MTIKIIKYFSKKSHLYEKKSNTFPWKYIRLNEVQKFMKVMPKKKFLMGLDLGCGAGFYTKILKNYCNKVIAVDYSHNMLKNIKDNEIIKIKTNANKLRLNKKFDIIICLGIFEFNKNYNQIFKTIKLHSDYKTNILMMIPYKNFFSLFYFIFHKLNNISLNIYSEKNLINLIKKNFIIKEIVFTFPFSIIFKCQKI